ncbi:MAG TPA: helix-turn-helix domain-containing protein [Steroidobacteraceae bacterium]
MSAIGEEISRIGEAHARILDELGDRPLDHAELAAATGLSGSLLLNSVRTLERGGRIRYVRGRYELTGSPVALRADDEGGMVLSPDPRPRPRPEPPAPASASQAAAAIATARATPGRRDATKPSIDETESPVGATKPAISETKATIHETPAPAGGTSQETAMPRGVYPRKPKTPRPAAAPNPPRPRRMTATVSSAFEPFHIPASPALAATFEDGIVKVANDPAHPVAMTLAQADQFADWWRRSRGTATAL